ncbi:unnamed protein product [Cyclocybe aegerita]|uniref:MYND-type domain-containing protein n=1 Tax=Cyclocybe aegerita TaxID=1973307 RepID=A0A8S0W4Y3_CYCAE|nr:unnamed protein product [Cyclocybe aegerita]
MYIRTFTIGLDGPKRCRVETLNNPALVSVLDKIFRTGSSHEMRRLRIDLTRISARLLCWTPSKILSLLGPRTSTGTFFQLHTFKTNLTSQFEYQKTLSIVYAALELETLEFRLAVKYKAGLSSSVDQFSFTNLSKLKHLPITHAKFATHKTPPTNEQLVSEIVHLLSAFNLQKTLRMGFFVLQTDNPEYAFGAFQFAALASAQFATTTYYWMFSRAGTSQAALERKREISMYCASARLMRRSFEQVKAGVEEGNVDDILEYCLRLVSGIDGVPVNLSEAMGILPEVIHGPFPAPKRAVAASLIGSISAFHMHKESAKESSFSPYLASGIMSCFASCELGLYSNSCRIFFHCCPSVSELAEILPEEEMDLLDRVTYLDERYLDFMEETNVGVGVILLKNLHTAIESVKRRELSGNMNRKHGMEARLGLGGGLVSEQSRKNLEKAEDLCRRRKPEQAAPYLLKAIKDHNNLDAIIQIAFLLPRPDAIEALEHAEERGRVIVKKALGEKAFDDDGDTVERFWMILETRPYMRVLQALVRMYFESGKFAESAKTIEEMLRLCPGDNLGQRYWMGSMLCQANRFSDALFFAQAWLTEHTRKTGDPPARGGTAFAAPSPAVPPTIDAERLRWEGCSLLYTAALASFKVYGDCEQSKKYLIMATQSNPNILIKILAKVPRPAGLNNDPRTPNGPEDAQDYLYLTQNFWMEKGIRKWADSCQDAKRLVLKSCSREACTEKEKDVAQFKRCAACHLVLYCGQNCQKVDWPRHKPECNAHKQHKIALRAFANGKAPPAGSMPMFSSDMAGGTMFGFPAPGSR